MRKPTQVILERQALGVSTESTFESTASSSVPSEALESTNILSQSDSAVLDSKSIFREQEEESENVQNYVDPEKAFKSDMQMINYKSRLPNL
jgi:hypothetical protein